MVHVNLPNGILMKHIFATPSTEFPAAMFALITFLPDKKIFAIKMSSDDSSRLFGLGVMPSTFNQLTAASKSATVFSR